MATKDEIKSGWIIPLEQRGLSGTFECHFLWHWQNVYVMDNHRIALWCWLRHLEPKIKLNILHMDEHYDCLMSRHDDWSAALPANLSSLSLEEYLEYPWQGNHEDVPLFRFDNYFSLFMARYGSHIANVYISTHGEGDCPFFHFDKFSILQCMSYLNAKCSNLDATKTILNIDIDYFTETDFDEPIIIVSRKYLQQLGKLIGKGLRNGAIKCLTLALSPEFSGSWEIAETVAGELLEAAGVPFSLPKK